MLKRMCWNRVALSLLFNVAGCYCTPVNLTFESTMLVILKASMKQVFQVISLRFRRKPSLLSQNSPKPCPNHLSVFTTKLGYAVFVLCDPTRLFLPLICILCFFSVHMMYVCLSRDVMAQCILLNIFLVCPLYTVENIVR
uniref:Secreted protein n=1 Tax=Rhipicephalus appendiculatus TaxID=34631 RepID=A0A131YC87_RHIAP